MSETAEPRTPSVKAFSEVDAGGCDWEGGFIASNIEFVADSFAHSTPLKK
jgi:hypothetical protein